MASRGGRLEDSVVDIGLAICFVYFGGYILKFILGVIASWCWVEVPKNGGIEMIIGIEWDVKHRQIKIMSLESNTLENEYTYYRFSFCRGTAYFQNV